MRLSDLTKSFNVFFRSPIASLFLLLAYLRDRPILLPRFCDALTRQLTEALIVNQSCPGTRVTFSNSYKT